MRQITSRKEAAGHLTILLRQEGPSEVDAGRSCVGGYPGPGPTGVLVPDSGPVGTRVSIVIDCLSGFEDQITHPAYGAFLIRDFGKHAACELIAGGPFQIKLVGRGRAAGWFTVGSQGACFQSGGKTRLVTPGVYGVGVGCHVCELATFRVTGS